MDEPQSKSGIFDLIRGERAALEGLLAKLNDAQMTQPGVDGDWTVKDLLAHIADWEKRLAGWIEESLRGETPQRPAPGLTWDDLDRLNAQMYQRNKDRPLSDVLADSQTSYQRALAAVESLSEEDLFDPARFAWRKGDPLWHMIAANTWWHYAEHAETIRNWLK